jgi:hypothetical protein
MIEPTNSKNAVTTNSNETDNILNAAQDDAGLGKILKFKKGNYLIGDDEIPLGTKFIVHTNAWVKMWLKFVDNRVADRKAYRVALGEKPPVREELDDLDKSLWSDGIDGEPADPWTLQYMMPFENISSGEVVIFTTSSVGGRRAVSDLCLAYARRAKKGCRGHPIVTLSVRQISKYKVPAPLFEITSWDDAADNVTDGTLEEPPPVTSEKEFDDEIPY